MKQKLRNDTDANCVKHEFSDSARTTCSDRPAWLLTDLTHPMVQVQEAFHMFDLLQKVVLVRVIKSSADQLSIGCLSQKINK